MFRFNLRSPLARLLVLVAVVVAGSARPAAAATVAVNPTTIQLRAGTSSVLLTIRNGSDEPGRFQVAVFAWDQRADGTMVLEPTTDIVLFPALITIPPQSERKVRIGTSTFPEASEKSYRVFVEELPPQNPHANMAAVHVLTKIGVPIFLQPRQPRAEASLAGLTLSDTLLSFTLRNTGSVRLLPDAVRVRGLGEEGRVVFEQALQSWYVLAGGTRVFAVAMPPGTCGSLSAVEAVVAIGSATLRERLVGPSLDCRR